MECLNNQRIFEIIKNHLQYILSFKFKNVNQYNNFRAIHIIFKRFINQLKKILDLVIVKNLYI